jgi:tRNA (cytidine/uridine-2'-O-)-methyltransferase
MPVHVVLFEPEIPPNTGNVIRLCANAGAHLHLVKPLGFRLDARSVRRSGLDYHELADVSVHDGFESCLQNLASYNADAARDFYAITTRGETRYDQVEFVAGDVLVFGPETRGLPADLLQRCAPERRLRIPTQPGARSLNLSNAVAILVYEAWRQLRFAAPSG